MYRKYKKPKGAAPISEFESGDNFIRVRFAKPRAGMGNRRTYEWRAWGVGQEAIDEMKKLADAGSGLEDFIANGVFLKQSSRIF